MVKRLRIFAGPNGSGKSVLYKSLVNRKAFHAACYINADEIKQCLDGSESVDTHIPPDSFHAYIRKSGFYTSRKIMSSDIAALAITESGTLSLNPGHGCSDYLTAAIADAIREYYLDNDISFTFETVMSDPSKIDFMKKARERGYRVYLYFITTSDPTINKERVLQRVLEGGHDVPENKILTRFSRSLDLLKKALPHTDRAYLFDNSSNKPELIAEVTYGNTLRFTETDVPGWAASLVTGEEK